MTILSKTERERERLSKVKRLSIFSLSPSLSLWLSISRQSQSLTRSLSPFAAKPNPVQVRGGNEFECCCYLATSNFKLYLSLDMSALSIFEPPLHCH